MNMEGLSFAYPTWYLLLCILLGLAYALTLYFRNPAFRDAPRWLNGLLGTLRFLGVTTLAVLLLSPILRSVETRTEKPVVVLAQDASASIGLAMKGADSTQYVQAMQQLQTDLGQDYDLVTYTFGDVVRDTLEMAFRDKRTNMAALLKELYEVYSNQNLGAVILASDGIYNEGANPVYTDAKLNAPVYTIALGDTTRYKDVTIKRVFHNKVAYLGDKFSIQVDVAAQNAAGNTVPLRIARLENGRTRELINESITIDRNDFFTTREYILDADLAGVNRYRISVGTLSGEASVVNNAREIFVDVLESRQKILLLAKAPHPDLTALKQSITEGKNNEVTIAYISTFTGDIRAFDMVVLHQLPAAGGTSVEPLLAQLKAKGTPLWFIVGQQSDFNALNKAQQIVALTVKGRSTNDVEARAASNFSLFKISDEVRGVLPKFPPLEVPFGDFKAGGNTSIMLLQRIGRIDTDYPLLAMGEEDKRRIVVLSGTGIWKWRLFDFLDSEKHDRFNTLVSQVTQYLSVKDDKRRFRVSLAKNIFDENESVIFDAELYNDNFELVNEPVAQMVITDEGGREYNYTFNASGRSYRLNAGILPTGSYRYRASVNTGTQTLEYSGQFSVQPIQLESYELTADHNLLRLLGERYGGELVYPSSIGIIPQLLKDRGTVKPVLYDTVSTRSLINLKGIFFLVLLLLALEWFLRRYFGGY